MSDVAQHAPSEQTLSVIEGALSTFSMIAMMTGPLGQVAGGIGLTATFILQTCYPGERGEELGRISDAIRNMSEGIQQAVEDANAQQRLVDCLSDINTYITWNKNQCDWVMNAKADKAQEKAFKQQLEEVKKYVDEACSPSEPLLQALSKLKQSYQSSIPFDAMALDVFALGAATHIHFEMCRSVMNQENTYNSPWSTEVARYAGDYSDHIDTVVKNKIESTINNRLSGIHPPGHTHYTVWQDYRYVGSVPITYLADDKAGVPPKRTTIDPLPKNKDFLSSLHFWWPGGDPNNRGTPPSQCIVKSEEKELVDDDEHCFGYEYVSQVEQDLRCLYRYDLPAPGNFYLASRNLQTLKKRFAGTSDKEETA